MSKNNILGGVLLTIALALWSYLAGLAFMASRVGLENPLLRKVMLTIAGLAALAFAITWTAIRLLRSSRDS